MIYCRNGVFFRVKNGHCAPRFVSFCSMYGDVLLYPVDDSGLAVRGEFVSGGARGAPCVSRGDAGDPNRHRPEQLAGMAGGG